MPLSSSVPLSAPVQWDQWVEDNHDHLLIVYEMLQDVCTRTGRCVFDKESCTFPRFCQLAYRNSSLYQWDDPNFTMTDEDESE